VAGELVVEGLGFFATVGTNEAVVDLPDRQRPMIPVFIQDTITCLQQIARLTLRLIVRDVAPGEVLELLGKGLGCTLARLANPRGPVWRPASNEGAPRWRGYLQASARASD
jgi:hypothetical protein